MVAQTGTYIDWSILPDCKGEQPCFREFQDLGDTCRCGLCLFSNWISKEKLPNGVESYVLDVIKYVAVNTTEFKFRMGTPIEMRYVLMRLHRSLFDSFDHGQYNILVNLQLGQLGWNDCIEMTWLSSKLLKCLIRFFSDATFLKMKSENPDWVTSSEPFPEHNAEEGEEESDENEDTDEEEEETPEEVA